MADRSASSTRNGTKNIPRFQHYADVFILNTDFDEHPEWAKMSDYGVSMWKEAVHFTRGSICPSFFEYSEYLQRGETPPLEGFEECRRRTKKQIQWDRMRRQMFMDPENASLREVHWRGPCLTTVSRDVSPSDTSLGRPEEATKPLDNEIKGAGPWVEEVSEPSESNLSWDTSSQPDVLAEPNTEQGQTHGSEHGDKYKNTETGVEPERIRSGYVEAHPDGTEGTITGDDDIEMIGSFDLDMNRPWTMEDEEQLFDLIHEDQEQDFQRISWWTQRTVEQCHQRYRQLASLQVEEPALGQWNAQKDEMLVRFIREYGVVDWNRIAFWCKTTPEDCKERWRELRDHKRQESDAEDVRDEIAVSKKPRKPTDRSAKASNSDHTAPLPAERPMLKRSREDEEAWPAAESPND